MIGLAALAFASCAKHDFETMTQEQIVKAEYEAKFVAAFGQPASNQNWGFATTRALTRTYNVQGNLWHDPNYFNLEYDAPVTAEEKNLVFNYVNNKNSVETVDQISFSKYWVAQIWNGEDDENASKVKAPTSTSYPDQNGATTTIVGGAQMDKLEILEKAGTWTHCNNFNGADNNDWIEEENGGIEGRTLMYESGTLSFRYTNSHSSYLSEKYIIVPGAKIDASLKDFYYVCFDYERHYTDADRKAEVTYFYVTPTDNNGAVQAQQKVTLNGYYTNDNIPDLTDAVKTLNSNYVSYTNASVAGYLNGKDFCDGDDNYTDWIVRISPAIVKEETPITYEGRIMAEDLTVATNSDWDFNDVVFDWTIKDGKAYINLLAAGGTLPIRVGGYRDDDTSEPIGSIEIHSAAALGGYMVNTGVNVGKTSAAFVLDDHRYADHDGNGILITVYKGGSWVEITAEQGEPAGKFNAPINTKWCEEYANIKKVYINFAAWVQDTEVEWAVNPTDKYVDYRDVNENRLEATAE